MNYCIDDVDGVKILRLREKRLDANISPALKSQLLLLVERGTSLLIDLSEVQYADSSGLGALLLGLRQTRDLNGQFGLIGAGKRVRSLIRIAQLEGVMLYFENEQQALDKIVEK